MGIVILDVLSMTHLVFFVDVCVCVPFFSCYSSLMYGCRVNMGLQFLIAFSVLLMLCVAFVKAIILF